MAIILFMGAVSGAHLNPAVSLAFAMRGDFPWKRVPGYIIVQLVGAVLASLFLAWVLGNIQLGMTQPGFGYADWQALLMEIALTTGLVSVILGTASGAQLVAESPPGATFIMPSGCSRQIWRLLLCPPGAVAKFALS
jgi:aquaporin Z